MKERKKVLDKRIVLLKLAADLNAEYPKTVTLERRCEISEKLNEIESKLDMIEWVLNYNYE